MARKLRLEYPGAIYHVMNRGDRRESIFHGDAQRAETDVAKVRLRAETVQTVAWLAKRLHLGSRAYANHLLWRARRESSAH